MFAMIALATPRLAIRRFEDCDAADLYEYLSDPEVVRFEPYDVFTPEDCQEETANRAGNPAFLAVCLKDTGKLIGNLYLDETEPEFSSWELGYVFNPKYQRMGYATEACRAALNDVFGRLRAHRVCGMCDPMNERSWKLLERLGMRRESHKIQNVCFRRDAQGRPLWTDTYEYAILAQEWRAKEGAPT
jgi:RimJ/RimL family protein N-acetyltransferase